MLTAELAGRNSGFRFAENTDDLFVGKTLLHGDVLMWLMKTLLTSGCINQRGAGQYCPVASNPSFHTSPAVEPEPVLAVRAFAAGGVTSISQL
ncbi:hypothetical protein FGF61_01535 (plasmid) [Citrobacter freundii]|nr:hypothetical protein FGF61_01535 [Citrobacter freundii]